MSKQKILLICFSFILATTVGWTAAYYTFSERAHNVIATNGVKIELVETALDANGREIPFADITNAVPGVSYSKLPKIKNLDTGEIWARIKMTQSAASQDGTEVDLPSRALNIDLDLENWVFNNGYYYYKTPLGVGEATTPLFTKVVIDPGMGNEYGDTKVSISLRAEAVQLANNGSDVLSAQGWPGGI